MSGIMNKIEQVKNGGYKENDIYILLNTSIEKNFTFGNFMYLRIIVAVIHMNNDTKETEKILFKMFEWEESLVNTLGIQREELQKLTEKLLNNHVEIIQKYGIN